MSAPGRHRTARTKRSYPATIQPHPASTSSVNENDDVKPLVAPKVPADSEKHAKPRLLIKLPGQVNPERERRKEIKLSLPAASADNTQNPSGQAARKCMHCEVTKTPQWRSGPMGPNTLCNACGVRYKSGRLFPEYRPARSPTFVPSLHSNSHKKVTEMRTKSGAAATTTMATTNSPELIPKIENREIKVEKMGV